MATIAKTRLTIREQGELLNQIAGTYKDFYRAAMEYLDNAADAATILRQSGASFTPVLKIHVDTAAKKVSFTDNCGGMTPPGALRSPLRSRQVEEKSSSMGQWSVWFWCSRLSSLRT